MNIHHVAPDLFTRPVKITLVGAGGTGSQLVRQLAQLHTSMLALGHPGGIELTVIDPDTVSQANVGRQLFYPSDVGQYKAEVLVNRTNLTLGTRWVARIGLLSASHPTHLGSDIVIGAVDNRSARLAILRCLEVGGGSTYWLDCGNRQDDGQVILGQVNKSTRKTDPVHRLPHVAEMFPEVIDGRRDAEEDQGPSCSLAQALERQSLFINQAVSLQAMTLLWQMFRHGQLTHHGAFINARTGQVTPLAIDPESWDRFGVVRDGVRRKIRSRAKQAA